MKEQERNIPINAPTGPRRGEARPFIRRPRLRLVVAARPDDAGTGEERKASRVAANADRSAAEPREHAGDARARVVDDAGERGFSLLELLVVVAILGILIAAALPKFAEFRAAAYDSRSQQDLRNLAAAEELYRATSPAYAGDTASLKGFAASEGVQVTLESANETGFVATATHPAGSRDYRWDSGADPALTSTLR